MDVDLEILNSLIYKKETTLINLPTFEKKQQDIKQYISRNIPRQLSVNNLPNRVFRDIQYNSSYQINYGGQSPFVNTLPELMYLMNNYTGNSNLMNIFMDINQGSLEDVPTPLDTKKMNQFPTKKYSECDDLENDTCAICQAKYADDDQLTILPCNGHHRYHQNCIEEWLSKFSKKCPSCRQNLDDL